MIEQLDKDKFPVTAAFWLYESDSDSWRLLIASPVVESGGTLGAYRRVDRSFSRLKERSAGNFDLEFTRVKMISPRDRLPTLLGRAVQTGPGIGSIKFSGVLQEMWIEDAYIYRIGKKPAAQPRLKKPAARTAARHP